MMADIIEDPDIVNLCIFLLAVTLANYHCRMIRQILFPVTRQYHILTNNRQLKRSIQAHCLLYLSKHCDIYIKVFSLLAWGSHSCKRSHYKHRAKVTHSIINYVTLSDYNYVQEL